MSGILLGRSWRQRKNNGVKRTRLLLQKRKSQNSHMRLDRYCCNTTQEVELYTTCLNVSYHTGDMCLLRVTDLKARCVLENSRYVHSRRGVDDPPVCTILVFDKMLRDMLMSPSVGKFSSWVEISDQSFLFCRVNLAAQ